MPKYIQDARRVYTHIIKMRDVLIFRNIINPLGLPPFERRQEDQRGEKVCGRLPSPLNKATLQRARIDQLLAESKYR